MRSPEFRRRYCHLECSSWLGSSFAVLPLTCSHIRSGLLTLNMQTELKEALMLFSYICFRGAACQKIARFTTKTSNTLLINITFLLPTTKFKMFVVLHPLEQEIILSIVFSRVKLRAKSLH